MIFKLILIILHICDTNVQTFTILFDRLYSTVFCVNVCALLTVRMSYLPYY